MNNINPNDSNNFNFNAPSTPVKTGNKIETSGIFLNECID